MTNPIIGKTSAKATKAFQETERKTTAKAEPSKFDRLRVRLQDQLPKLPPEVTHVSLQEKKQLEGVLRRRLERLGHRETKESFKVDMKKTEIGLESLRRQISTAPKSPAFEAVRQRLSGIEAQFTESGKLLSRLDNLDSPRDMLKMQLEMYKLTQNIEIMSNVVGKLNESVNKLIFQTQV